MLLAGFLPWSLLLPAALRDVLARQRRAGPEVFCVVWSVGVLLFFSVSRGKLGTYILPALPALALLTGRYLVRLARSRVLPPTERRLVAAGAIVMALVCFAAAPGLHAASARLYEGAWRETSRLALIGLPLGAALLALVLRGRFDRLPVAIAGGMLAVIVVFYGLAAPEVSAVVSEAAVARLIAAHPDGARAPVIGFNVRASSLLFYLKRPVRRTTHRAKVADVLAKRPLVFVMTSPRHVPVLLRLGGLYPWHTLGRHVLYASRPPGAAEAATLR
jgi:hypothetical protein